MIKSSQATEIDAYCVTLKTIHIQLRYQKIAEVIEETGAEAHPTDYLMFFCLAKREGKFASMYSVQYT